MISQTRNQRSGQRNNITETRRMIIYTNLLRIHLKEPNQKVIDYHQWYQQIISHIWPPNTHNTRQGNQKDPIPQQDNSKESLAPSYGQTSPKCGAIHKRFFVNGSNLLHTKIGKI